jgi:hypothetical protein
MYCAKKASLFLAHCLHKGNQHTRNDHIMIGSNPLSSLTTEGLSGQDTGILSLLGKPSDAPKEDFGSILGALDGFSGDGMMDLPKNTSESSEGTAPFLPFLFPVALPVLDFQNSPTEGSNLPMESSLLDGQIPLGLPFQNPPSENRLDEKSTDLDSLKQANSQNDLGTPSLTGPLPFVPAALPSFAPVHNDVKTLVGETQDGGLSPVPLAALKGYQPPQPEALTETPAPIDKTASVAPADPAGSAKPPLAALSKKPDTSAPAASMPTVQEDLDAALNAMASLKAPMQVADNKRLSGTDRPLTAPLPDLTPTHQGEALSVSQQPATVLAQAESLPIKTPAALPAEDTKKKPALTTSPVPKEVAAVNDTPKDTTPVRLASFDDAPQNTPDPVKALEFSTVADASPLKVEGFGAPHRQDTPLGENGPLSMPTASLSQPLSPMTDTTAASSQRLMAFHQAATLTPMETQHARENLAMTIKKGMDDENTQIRIKMSPERLGTVDVAMEIAQDGTVNAVIGTDRQDTYDWLRRDASSLQDMLQQAGLKMGQGGLSFAYHDQRQAFEQKVADLKGRTSQTDPDVKTVAMRSLSYNPNQALDIHA